ncbi:helix-turn-helix domain-containing protein [Epilithonimonas vandammei]|uniref:AraC family transcriptional regulator n=1 Tax=Epilithonimonas vandammei TaxID=2487072 RepID=A0A3G8YCJ0_9FLAO|nr:AraC family transcriptional regulator [Epilithonimonas vandammei]AZI38616.1 AraC family transcriptional regulator [Epilithonimonas vandammei]
MKNLKYLFILLLIYGKYYSQNKVIIDTLSKYNYLELEDKFYNFKDNNKIKESKIIAKYYLERAKRQRKSNNVAEGYVFMQYNQNLATSLKYIDSLESISNELFDNRYPARIYLLKGKMYFDHDNEKLAFDNFIIALSHAKKNNNKRQIAIADLQIAYLNGYIGKHKETVKVLEHYYKNTEFLTPQDIEHIKISLADAYIDIYEYDKALKLIKEGLKESSKNNEFIKYNKYLILLGRHYLETKNYSQSISNLETCKRYFLKNNLDFDANYTMLYLGESYIKTNKKDKVVDNFIKIDSIIQKTNNTFPELRDVYTYLVDYYKEKKDKEKQLYYIERFLEVDKVLDSQFKYISRELPRKYDAPKLLKEKENIISDLEKKKYFLFSSLGILLLLLIALVVSVYRSKKSEKKYREIAQDLIKSINEKRPETEEKQEPEDFISSKVDDIAKTEKSVIRNISEDTVQKILTELEHFEHNELFLQKGITLSSLAKDFKTNSTYLSDVVNTYKKKNFATYLNDLRIDYALNRLVKDKKFRSYKLTVVADELGYNNEQAFASAFRKKTGTILRTYIKEINQSLE